MYLQPPISVENCMKQVFCRGQWPSVISSWLAPGWRPLCCGLLHCHLSSSRMSRDCPHAPRSWVVIFQLMNFIFSTFLLHTDLCFPEYSPCAPTCTCLQSPPSPLHLHFNLQNLCKTWDACNISHPAPTAPHVCRLRVHGAARVGSRGLMNIFILLSARKCWRMTAGRGAAALAKHSTTNFAALLHNNVHTFTRDEEIRMGAW